MDRLRLKTAVYGIIINEDRVFCLRRFNTGWMDGKYTLPSGHIESGELPRECMVRELKEESGIKTTEANLKFAHTMYRKDIYIDFYFFVTEYTGKPKLMEPEKSDKCLWIDPKTDGELLIPSVKIALAKSLSGISYSELAEEPQL